MFFLQISLFRLFHYFLLLSWSILCWYPLCVKSFDTFFYFQYLPSILFSVILLFLCSWPSSSKTIWESPKIFSDISLVFFSIIVFIMSVILTFHISFLYYRNYNSFYSQRVKYKLWNPKYFRKYTLSTFIYVSIFKFYLLIWLRNHNFR